MWHWVKTTGAVDKGIRQKYKKGAEEYLKTYIPSLENSDNYDYFVSVNTDLRKCVCRKIECNGWSYTYLGE